MPLFCKAISIILSTYSIYSLNKGYNFNSQEDIDDIKFIENFMSPKFLCELLKNVTILTSITIITYCYFLSFIFYKSNFIKILIMIFLIKTFVVGLYKYFKESKYVESDRLNKLYELSNIQKITYYINDIINLSFSIFIFLKLFIIY